MKIEISVWPVNRFQIQLFFFCSSPMSSKNTKIHFVQIVLTFQFQVFYIVFFCFFQAKINTFQQLKCTVVHTLEKQEDWYHPLFTRGNLHYYWSLDVTWFKHMCMLTTSERAFLSLRARALRSFGSTGA